jgi:alcohol dehydrogenase (cytochrome c)
MKIAAVLFVILGAPLLTQTSAPPLASRLAGTWQAQSTPPGPNWRLVLRADGPNVVGAVRCGGRTPVEIYDTHLEEDTVAFKCKSLDADELVTFTGTVSGDTIAFVAAFSDRRPGSDVRFTAARVPDIADDTTAAADHARRAPAVTFDRILHAADEPQNWLTYSGSVLGDRYSRLTQINAENVNKLELAWLWQTRSAFGFEATPLVVDGVLYTVQPASVAAAASNDIVAIDAATGRVIWTYAYRPLPSARASGGRGGHPNRGLAILGGTLFVGTIDAHLLAIDAFSGRLLWNTTVADAADPVCRSSCYVITHAPLVLKDKVVVGVGGGEGPIRGFIAAFDAKTGKEAWRFSTIPQPGEPGNDTWSGESGKTGGAAIWNIGSYDRDLNLTYWGTGNPFPNGAGANTRLGDNLFSDSVVALDADTGALKWHYQFTPHDDMDWDAAQVPVLADIEWQGRPRSVMLWANRNGLMYVLDRRNGHFLMGKPFVDVNWMSGFDDAGRPIRVAGKVFNGAGRIMPGASPTSWQPPSYSPQTGLFYIPAWERGSEHGELVGGPGYGAVRAFDPKTGKQVWDFRVNDAIFNGVLTTAAGLLFSGVAGDGLSANPSPEAIASGAKPGTRVHPDPARLADGYFYALNARTGQLLWKTSLAAGISSGPMSYAVNGKQYVAVAAGSTLFAFALRQ